MAVDFGDHVSLAEKEGVDMAKRGGEEKRKCAAGSNGRRQCGWAARSNGMVTQEAADAAAAMTEKCGSDRGHGLQEIGFDKEKEPSTSFMTEKAKERYGSSRQRRLRVAIGRGNKGNGHSKVDASSSGKQRGLVAKVTLLATGSRGGKWGDGMAAAARHVALWQGTTMLLGRWAAARGDGGQRRGQRLWLTRAMATAAIVGVGGDGSGCYGWLQHGGSAASRVAAKGEDEEVVVVKVCFPFFPNFRTTMLRSLL
ncbi:hypothetical protein BHE74_00058589 [Ensete ventricosum]|nr:hypothetical protein BHE74_00058589 [Ensete ventricosum]